MSHLKTLKRLVDSQPIVAHLYVTDRCNLDCRYCNEYDNTRPHPRLADLTSWIDKIRSLGVLRLGLQGGEPLLHPNIIDIVRYAKKTGFSKISLSTNGFLLTESLIQELEQAGLDSLQLSVDRMTPIESTKKAFKTVAHKLAFFENSKIRVNVSGVLFDDTLAEMRSVIDTSVQRGISAHARLAHQDGVKGQWTIQNREKRRLYSFIQELERRKKQGETIHSTFNIIDYQKAILEERPIKWQCLAGYKYFFVSAQGDFWPCSQVRTKRSIMEIVAQDLLSYNYKKDCQDGCGVYCTVSTSLLINKPMRFFTKELKGLLIRFWNKTVKPTLAPEVRLPSFLPSASFSKGKL